MPSHMPLAGALLVAVVSLVPAVSGAATEPTTRLVSKNSEEYAADAQSQDPAVSETGRYIAFTSDANNLSLEDNNAVLNVFVHDRETGRTALISRTSAGVGADGESRNPSISANGRYVAFQSAADNLSDRDDDPGRDVFVHDRATGRTELVSRSTAGAGGDAESLLPSISADGRFVAFQSDADNLSGADDNGVTNIFVRDREKRKTILVSRTSRGAAADGSSGAPSISANGRYVAFQSQADNLSGADNDAFVNIFVRDLERKRTMLVSRTSHGAGANDLSIAPSISASGRFVAFTSGADNLSSADNDAFGNIFVRDLERKKTILISRASDGEAASASSGVPSISASGRYVAFRSGADNLSNEDNDAFDNVFVRDRKTGRTTLLSRTSNGTAADGASDTPALSGTGRYVAFRSEADNLSGADNNAFGNIFLRGPLF